MDTIETILQRHESSGYIHLCDMKPTLDERSDLRGIWNTLTSQIYRILVPYSQPDGTYEQEASPTRCRFVDSYSLWLCADGEEGMFLASCDDGENWALEEED